MAYVCYCKATVNIAHLVCSRGMPFPDGERNMKSVWNQLGSDRFLNCFVGAYWVLTVIVIQIFLIELQNSKKVNENKTDFCPCHDV